MSGQRSTPPPSILPVLRVDAPSQRVATTPPLRVATTSNNITLPNTIQKMPFIHQRYTCSSNPFHILTNYDDDYDTVVASNCSPHTLLPSPPPVGLPVKPPEHPEPCQLTNQPALRPITVHPMPLQLESQPTCHPTTSQPSIPPPKVLANLSFIPATTPSVPHNNVHDLRPNQLQMPFQQPANTKKQSHSLTLVEPDDNCITTPPARPTALPRCSTQLISNRTPCNILRQALYHIINLGFRNLPAITIPQSLARNHYTGRIIEI
jgi:hypothetical protein